jgi:hypothetical protein
MRPAPSDRPTAFGALGRDRRSFLGGAMACAVLASAARAQDAPVSARFRGVRVDVQPLVARGGGASARLIAQVLPGKLSQSFADLIAPGDARAPVLVARIDTIYLSSFVDRTGPGFDSFGSMDSLEGAGLVVAGGQIVATTPLRVTLPASYSGANYLPDIDERRIVSLSESFASWLRREMNL